MKILVLLICIVMIGCEETPVRASQSKEDRMQTETGVIRSVDWYNRSFILESGNGDLKSFWPLCDPSMPVWQGVKVQLWYQWTTGTTYYGHSSGCFAIRGVKRIS